MKECRACLTETDDDGVTTSQCPVARPADAECDECGACFCDGSC